ncbi:MAG: hypothetical protein IT513_16515 [Burkholderiales bacterium]|nr:hypothetical protein [Burkholderiales bacterium]
MTPMLFIAVEFCDGSKLKYSFPLQSANDAARQMKLEDLMKGRHLVIQCEGRLVMHPMENIKTLELSTGGASLEGIQLPLHTIREAKPE